MDHLMGYINKHIPQFGVLMVYATLGEYFQTLYSNTRQCRSETTVTSCRILQV